MKKYEVRIKKAGWEKEDIPDQLFVPRSRSVSRNPDKLEFDPLRYKPVRNRRGIPKPEGGLWTSDYDYEKDSSPWIEYLQENMPFWIPKGESGLILKPDPETSKVYHINDVDDYLRIKQEFPAYHHYALDEDHNLIPGKELETINYEKLFDPIEQGGAGLHGLRVQQEALNELGLDGLNYWDIPSSVWSPGAPLREVGRMTPGKDKQKYTQEFHERYSSLNSLFKKVAHLDSIGAYAYSDNITERIILAENDINEIQEIDQEIQVDPTSQDLLEKEELLSSIANRVKVENFNMLSVGEDSKTPKGLASGYITGILYLEPGASSIYNMNEFEKYAKSQEKSKKSRVQLWQEFKQNKNPDKEVVTCTHASPSCLKDCIYHTGNARFDNVHAAREMRTSRLFHPETKEDTLLEIEIDIMRLKNLCIELNTRYKYKLKKYFGEGFQFQPVIRLNGTTDINWAKEAAYLHEKFKSIKFYDYTKVPKYMDMYMNGYNNYTKQPFAPNYHLTFSRSETNKAQALDYLERGGNVAIVFDKTPETLTYHGKTYRVIDGDRHDLRFLDDVEGMKQPNEGLVIGLKYKRPSKTEDKRKQKVTRQKELSPMFSKLEMLGEGQEVHEAPFVITTNGEKNVIVG
jgi:hypothetical protein